MVSKETYEELARKSAACQDDLTQALEKVGQGSLGAKKCPSSMRGIGINFLHCWPSRGVESSFPQRPVLCYCLGSHCLAPSLVKMHYFQKNSFHVFPTSTQIHLIPRRRNLLGLVPLLAYFCTSICPTRNTFFCPKVIFFKKSFLKNLPNLIIPCVLVFCTMPGGVQ